MATPKDPHAKTLSPSFELQWYRFVGAVCESTAATLEGARDERLSHARRVVELVLTRVLPRDPNLAMHLLNRMVEVADLAPEEMPWSFTTADLEALVQEVAEEALAA